MDLNYGLDTMVTLHNSGDEKQLWTDLINQLNGVYDCFSFLEQHKVAAVNQERGPELPVWGKVSRLHHLPSRTDK